MLHNEQLKWSQYTLIVFNLCVLLTGLSNLSFNNFVFPETRFYDTQIWIWNFAYRLLLYYPIFIPALFYFYRFEIGTLKNIKLSLFVYLFLSLFSNVPASYIILDGSFDLIAFSQLWIIYGVTIPFVVLFLYIAITTKACKKPFQLSWTFLFSIFFILILLRIVFTGAALPRLEDEVAYYLQALIFESGNIKSELKNIGFLKPTSIDNIYHMPYILANDGSYYSVHLHAWSYLLSLALEWKPWINYVMYVLTLPLFIYGNRVLEIFPRKWETMALLGFFSIPVLYFQNNSYMAHPSTLLLHLGAFILWFQIKKISSGMRSIPLYFVFLVVALLVLIWRPQVGVPMFLALCLCDIYYFYKQKHLDSLRLRRVFILFMAGLGAYFVLNLYSKQIASNSVFFTADYFFRIFGNNCQSLGFGEGHGCFPTLGTAGYSFRKVIIRFFELLSMANQELSAFALPIIPILLYLLYRHKLNMKNPDSIMLPMVLMCLLHFGVFLLYFHNGGENYRGRYLTEISYLIYYLFFYLLYLEYKDENSSLHDLLIRFNNLNFKLFSVVVILCLFSLQFTRTRGNFIQTGAPSFFTVPAISGTKIQNSLIYAKENIPFAQKLTKQGTWSFPNEFQHNNKEFTKYQIKAAFSSGLTKLVATSVRIDANGFLRDKNQNVLVAELPIPELEKLRQALRLKQIYKLSYSSAEIIKVSKNIKKVSLPKLILERIGN